MVLLAARSFSTEGLRMNAWYQRAVLRALQVEYTTRLTERKITTR